MRVRHIDWFLREKMEKRPSINPIENIRLSSELWRENVQHTLSKSRQLLISLFDRTLINQINFIDRMKRNAEIAADLQTENVSSLGETNSADAEKYFLNSMSLPDEKYLKIHQYGNLKNFKKL